jgi:DNA-binding NarL/FixJ family response regulator
VTATSARRRSELPDLVMFDRRAFGRSTEVRVLVAHGEQLVRAGLRALLEAGSDIAVSGEARSGREAVALASRIRPDVVLMHACLPGMDGVEATSRITADPELSSLGVLILSEDEGDKDLFAALRAGASGFLTSETKAAELQRAVRILAGGGAELSPHITRRLIHQVASEPVRPRRTPELFDALTVREREVVALVAEGLSNSQIAERLVLSPATAKTHVSRSMVKLRIRDRAKLVALAHQSGFAQSCVTRPGARTPLQLA